MKWSLFLFVILNGGIPFSAFGHTGAESSDHHWKIEIQLETHRALDTGFTDTPRGRLILHDLVSGKDQIIWEETSQWLPSPSDAAKAIWRADNLAFTLPDYARKWSGFAVYVLQGQKWVQAQQSNDFLGQFAQQGGAVSNLRWDKDNRLRFRFLADDTQSFSVIEKLTDETTNPKVIYIEGMEKSSSPEK